MLSIFNKQNFILIIKLSKAHIYLSSFFYIVLFCLFSVFFLDKPLLELAYKYKNSSFAENVSFLTIFSWSIWWYLLSFVAWIGFMAMAGVSLSSDGLENNWQKARSFLFMLFAIIFTNFLTILIKCIVGRYRPEIWMEEGIYGSIFFSFDFLTSSFPTMAAGTVVAAMTSLWLIYPRYDIFYVFFALLMLFCLFASGKEFLSDTLFGGYLGLISTLCLNKLYQKKGINIRILSQRDVQWQQIKKNINQ